MRWFSKIDLSEAYYQICMKEGHESRTVFKGFIETFEYTVMLFRLCNAPAIFLRRMDDILRAINDQRVQCYLDDIIVSPESRDVCKS
jgi:Reverse transcriptase (RNA-dependent DNA polymerase)